MQGGRIMTVIHDRMKNYRNRLHLSQEYVANFLGINRASYTQMENGKRKVTAEAERVIWCNGRCNFK